MDSGLLYSVSNGTVKYALYYVEEINSLVTYIDYGDGSRGEFVEPGSACIGEEPKFTSDTIEEYFNKALGNGIPTDIAEDGTFIYSNSVTECCTVTNEIIPITSFVFSTNFNTNETKSEVVQHNDNIVYYDKTLYDVNTVTTAEDLQQSLDVRLANL